MSKLRTILVRRHALAPRAVCALALCGWLALAGCGQRGPLYLPTDPAATNRATLQDLLSPVNEGAGTPTRSTDLYTTPVTPITPPQPAQAASAPKP